MKCLFSSPSIDLIIAIIGVFGIFLTNFLAKRKEVKFEERKLKEKAYLDFIEITSEMVSKKKSHNELSEESKLKYPEIHNRIMLIGSGKVINSVIEYTEFNKLLDTSIEEHDKVYTKMVKAMRKDLFNSIFINRNIDTIWLFSIAEENNEEVENNFDN